MTQTGRQTGSSFKGITLATALEAGYSPNDLVSGGSFTIKRPQSEDKRLGVQGRHADARRRDRQVEQLRVHVAR